MTQVILKGLVIIGMLLSWKFGYETGWTKGFELGKNLPKNKK